MKFILIFLSICFFSVFTVHSQPIGPSSNTVEQTINPFFDFYSDNSLSTISSGRGFTGVAGINDISGTYLNPASLDINGSYQISVNYTFKNTIRWRISPFLYDNIYIKQVFPSASVGASYKINKFLNAGFIYRNDFSYRMVIEDNTVYDEFGNYIGKSDIVNKFVTHSLNLPVSFHYKWIRLGANLNLTYFKGNVSYGEGINHKDYPLLGKTGKWKLLPQFGLIINPINEFSFGVTYTFGFSDNFRWEYNKSTSPPQETSVQWSPKFGAGTELRLFQNKLKFAFDYQYVNTKKVSHLKDRNDFYFGTEYNIDNSSIIRAGFCTLFDYRDVSSGYIDSAYNYNQYFLTFGGTYKYKEFSLNIAFMDSHLFTARSREYTKVSVGISYEYMGKNKY